jgi:Ca2+-binding RTX toxin-like protein
LFFTADSADNGRERDVFFSQSPFSRLDPQSMIVTITGTDFADYTTMRVEGNELILTQNGFEERHDLSLVGRIEAFLKKGNDIFVSDASVVIPTYAIGDEGDDRMVGGAGNDTLTGGAGRNVIWGGEGNDRLNGAGGRDVIVGEGGDDSIMAQGGNDVLLGGHGSDWIQAGLGDDQVFGSLGADRLYGEDGNDTIYGQLSADLIDGGAGDE